ncbi:MAG: multiheme c-type cytochrome [SAR324 cluster bacterium]|nr:multiheme c-type cytochrome [SAR324 cluster bacterium]
MYKKIALILLFLGICLIWAGFLHRDVSKEVTYVTSASCESCHSEHYESWNKTLHPKMFRPVSGPNHIQGDFSKPNPLVKFKKEEIEYVVGNKWEQVYVRKIDGEYYPFTAKWMITAQHWVPYKVDTWKEITMSSKCNGCHTTGFNAETSEFAEFGIGCEACHGPGSKHVQNQRINHDSSCSLCHGAIEAEKDILVSRKASVCGQCHNRGSNKAADGTKGKFNFPINFKPGDDLNKNFDMLLPKNDKKGKFWWGNGISKNRHQEYADWQNSKHYNSLKLMHEKYDESRGEKTDQCLACHSGDYILANKGNKPTLKTASEGVSCAVCHDPHGFGQEKKGHNIGTENCAGCHIDSMSKKISETGKVHYPCPPSAVTCADCHMPRVVTTGGDYTLRSHAFKVISPSEALKGQPNSCQNSGCHSDKDLEWAKQAFQNHYPPKKKAPASKGTK